MGEAFQYDEVSALAKRPEDDQISTGSMRSPCTAQDALTDIFTAKPLFPDVCPLGTAAPHPRSVSTRKVPDWHSLMRCDVRLPWDRARSAGPMDDHGQGLGCHPELSCQGDDKSILKDIGAAATGCTEPARRGEGWRSGASKSAREGRIAAAKNSPTISFGAPVGIVGSPPAKTDGRLEHDQHPAHAKTVPQKAAGDRSEGIGPLPRARHGTMALSPPFRSARTALTI